MIRVLDGDMRDVVPTLDRIDCCITDPPYHLIQNGLHLRSMTRNGNDRTHQRNYQERGFMNQAWDGGDIAFQADTWWPVFTALKPGGFLIAFASTRGYHRMVCAIEDAGFIIHPMIGWIFGTGFPKATRFEQPELAGWRYGLQTLKPALEPICLAQKPMEGTGSQNWAKHGVGGLHIDACRVESGGEHMRGTVTTGQTRNVYGKQAASFVATDSPLGRWPSNVLHDGSDEVLEAFAAYGERRSAGHYPSDAETSGALFGHRKQGPLYGDTGSAARFFKSCGYSDSELLLCRAKDTFPAWNGSINASDAGRILDPRSEQFASALSDAVAQSMQPLGLLKPSYQGRPTNVTASELRTVCASVTALIQNIAQRCSQEWPDGKLTLHNDPVNCVALQKPTGITTITVSLSKSDGCAELATFDITPMNSEPGEAVLSGSRFHYTSKADKADRADSKHPTVKPLALMVWLTKLVCPPGGTVLDPFAGSGVTAEACMLNGFDCILVEQNPEYCRDIRHRVARWSGLDTPLFAAVAD